MGTEVEDKTATEVGGGKPITEEEASTAEEGKPSGEEEGKPLETEEDPANAQADVLQSILTTHNLDTPEDLADFLGDLVGLKEKLGDDEVEDLLENKETLMQYHRVWAQQEEEKKRANETESETIKRLEGEIVDRDKKTMQAKKVAEQDKENARLVSNFNRSISREVDSNTSIPKYLKAHMKMFLGVDNPIHDIDLSDRKGVKKMVENLAKHAQSLMVAIKSGGKETIPDPETPGQEPAKETPPMQRGAEPGTPDTKPKIKNLKAARKIATERLVEAMMRKKK